MAMLRCVRLEVGDVAVVEDDRAGAQPLEAGDAGERRALAAARRPQQGQELAVGDRDVEAVDGGDVADSAWSAAAA